MEVVFDRNMWLIVLVGMVSIIGNRFTRGWNRFAGLKALECLKPLPSESTLLSTESIRFCTRSKKSTIDVLQNLYREPRSGGAGKVNDSAYGNSGPSGVIVYDRGRMIGPRGSTTDGYPVLVPAVPDRLGLAMITDRVQVPGLRPSSDHGVHGSGSVK
ncbi:hypothetical protein PIB30_083628, partial [Stylosanthes scabra]|nr:hypothetical protein [Stylosanthes scabra]